MSRGQRLRILVHASTSHVELGDYMTLLNVILLLQRSRNIKHLPARYIFGNGTGHCCSPTVWSRELLGNNGWNVLDIVTHVISKRKEKLKGNTILIFLLLLCSRQNATGTKTKGVQKYSPLTIWQTALWATNRKIYILIFKNSFIISYRV